MIKESGFNVQSVDLNYFIYDVIRTNGSPLNPGKVLPCVQKVTKNVWLILWNMLDQFLLLSTLQIHLSNFTNLEFTTNQTVRHKILTMVFLPLVSEKKMVTRYVTKPDPKFYLKFLPKIWPKTSGYLTSKSEKFEIFDFELSKIEIIIWYTAAHKIFLTVILTAIFRFLTIDYSVFLGQEFMVRSMGWWWLHQNGSWQRESLWNCLLRSLPTCHQPR